jgi:hypothetical protein
MGIEGPAPQRYSPSLRPPKLVQGGVIPSLVPIIQKYGPIRGARMDYLGQFEPSYSYDDEPVKKKTILDVPPDQLEVTEGEWEHVMGGRVLRRDYNR